MASSRRPQYEVLSFCHKIKENQKQNKCSYGNTIHGDREIAHTAEEFFKAQFSSQQMTPMDLEDAFHGFASSVTPEINADLTRPVTIEEIKEAIYAIGAHKAPGPDGFTGAFLSYLLGRYWTDHCRRSYAIL